MKFLLFPLAVVSLLLAGCSIDSTSEFALSDQEETDDAFQAKSTGVTQLVDAIMLGSALIQDELDNGATIAFTDISMTNCTLDGCDIDVSLRSKPIDTSTAIELTDKTKMEIIEEVYRLALLHGELDLVLFSSVAKGKTNWGLVITV